jgi:MtN3 and saliva related transmembrane protein
MNLIDWVGSVAAFLTTASFIPQAWLTFKTKDVSGISLGMYSVFTTGVAAWLVYGLMLGAWPVVVANAVTLALAETDADTLADAEPLPVPAPLAVAVAETAAVADGEALVDGEAEASTVRLAAAELLAEDQGRYQTRAAAAEELEKLIDSLEIAQSGRRATFRR